MANLLWGKIYYLDQFAGYLRQEPGERYTFTYDESYLESTNPAIAMTLPRREAPFISEGRPAAIEKVHSADRGLAKLKSKIIRQLEKRWRGTFSLIGQLLSKKP